MGCATARAGPGVCATTPERTDHQGDLAPSALGGGPSPDQLQDRLCALHYPQGAPAAVMPASLSSIGAREKPVRY